MCVIMIYGQGIYRIIHDKGGWCVAKLSDRYEDGRPRWRRMSNLYRFRGWAQAWSRRMGIKVQNYESDFA